MVRVCFSRFPQNIFTKHVLPFPISPACHHTHYSRRSTYISKWTLLFRGVGRKSRPASRALDVPIHSHKEPNYTSQLYTSQQDFQGQVFDLWDHALHDWEETLMAITSPALLISTKETHHCMMEVMEPLGGIVNAPERLP